MASSSASPGGHALMPYTDLSDHSKFYVIKYYSEWNLSEKHAAIVGPRGRDENGRPIQQIMRLWPEISLYPIADLKTEIDIVAKQEFNPTDGESFDFLEKARRVAYKVSDKAKLRKLIFLDASESMQIAAILRSVCLRQDEHMFGKNSMVQDFLRHDHPFLDVQERQVRVARFIELHGRPFNAAGIVGPMTVAEADGKTKVVLGLLTFQCVNGKLVAMLEPYVGARPKLQLHSESLRKGQDKRLLVARALDTSLNKIYEAADKTAGIVQNVIDKTRKLCGKISEADRSNMAMASLLRQEFVGWIKTEGIGRVVAARNLGLATGPTGDKLCYPRLEETMEHCGLSIVNALTDGPGSEPRPFLCVTERDGKRGPVVSKQYFKVDRYDPGSVRSVPMSVLDEKNHISETHFADDIPLTAWYVQYKCKDLGERYEKSNKGEAELIAKACEMVTYDMRMAEPWAWNGNFQRKIAVDAKEEPVKKKKNTRRLST